MMLHDPSLIWGDINEGSKGHKTGILGRSFDMDGYRRTSRAPSFDMGRYQRRCRVTRGCLSAARRWYGEISTTVQSYTRLPVRDSSLIWAMRARRNRQRRGHDRNHAAALRAGWGGPAGGL